MAQVGLKLAQVGLKLAQVGLKLAQVGLMLPQVGSSWPQVGSSWAQVGPKLAIKINDNYHENHWKIIEKSVKSLKFNENQLKLMNCKHR